MAIEQLGLNADVVTPDQIMAITNGALPASVAQIDAVGIRASQFTARWSSMDFQRQTKPRVVYAHADGTAIWAADYERMAQFGNRDYWRQDAQSQKDLLSIANGGSGVHEIIRTEAFNLLALSQEMEEVERAERAAAIAERREILHVARQRYMSEAVFTQDTTSPLAAATNPAPVQKSAKSAEVRSHRSKPKGRLAMAIGSLASKISTFFAPSFV